MSWRHYNPLPGPVPVATFDAADNDRRASAQQGSDALLRAQIRSGQHFLSADALAALREAKGW